MDINMNIQMEDEKVSVLTLIDNNKQQIYKTLDKMESLLKIQEDMCQKQEETILRNLKQDQYEQLDQQAPTLEQCQSSSVQLLENIYYLITKIDKNFDQILNNLPKNSSQNIFKKNNELDLIVNKLLLDAFNENLESCGQVIEDSKYLQNYQIGK
ncbi:hypothetical protein TTHERM_00028490 (macronuclear) [Tetrahymena thermophila SB210]|uniref:Uncharacterized protein n=1 Tax=Tetrahymena thermophila (strain SB210) TaxID=312017 RepID=Q22N25_TETTS|nr:hypothetical protein TTHERM_00028490 [Tetrahymena thermophila SB210]EAR86391.1 hypothetical protein TTHERM_00028490 [Tetrahymena thermophila SB210]|eukprot:XP_976845.1 hypothetical protein TTHERM_00028490 [Tetrahymena thermophila SB210]